MNLQNKLEILGLYFEHLNIFTSNHNIIPILARINTLKQLSIRSGINDAKNLINNINIKNISLQELKLEFTQILTFRECADPGQSIQDILSELFSIFIGIKHFEFKDARYSAQSLRIDWKSVFNTLFEHKTSQSLYHDNIPSLQSLECNVDCLDGIGIIQGLMHCYDEAYCNLNHFGMDVCRYREAMRDLDDDNLSSTALIKGHLIPFMKLSKVETNLKSMQFDGERRTVMSVTYMDSVITLLSNLPKSLISLDISLPDHHESMRSVSQIVGRER